MNQNSQITIRHLQVVFLCLFVCLFFAHAKLSVYEQHQADNAATSTHLWVSGQKIEVQEHGTFVPPLLVLILFVWALSVPKLSQASIKAPMGATLPCRLLSFEIQHCFKPPPAFVSVRL